MDFSKVAGLGRQHVLAYRRRIGPLQRNESPPKTPGRPTTIAWLSAAFGRAATGAPAIGDERERSIIARAGRMLDALGLLPDFWIDRREQYVALGPQMNESHRDRFGHRQALGIDLAPADHGDFARPPPQRVGAGDLERGLQPRRDDDPRRAKIAVAADHDVGAARQRPPDGGMGLAA